MFNRRANKQCTYQTNNEQKLTCFFLKHTERKNEISPNSSGKLKTYSCRLKHFFSKMLHF